MSKKNLDIREYARNKGIPFWRIAEKYGMADSNFSRMLRHEVPEERKPKLGQLLTNQRRIGGSIMKDTSVLTVAQMAAVLLLF